MRWFILVLVARPDARVAPEAAERRVRRGDHRAVADDRRGRRHDRADDRRGRRHIGANKPHRRQNAPQEIWFAIGHPDRNG